MLHEVSAMPPILVIHCVYALPSYVTGLSAVKLCVCMFAVVFVVLTLCLEEFRRLFSFW